MCATGGDKGGGAYPETGSLCSDRSRPRGTTPGGQRIACAHSAGCYAHCKRAPVNVADYGHGRRHYLYVWLVDEQFCNLEKEGGDDDTQRRKRAPACTGVG